MELSVITKLFVGFLTLLLIVRLVGKKELAEASPLDIVYAVALGDLILDAVYDPKIPVHETVIYMFIWTLFMMGADYLTRKFKKVNRWVNGQPEILIREGVMDSEVMNKNRLTEDEIKSLLRQQGVFRIKEVKLCILEANGSISVMSENRT